MIIHPSTLGIQEMAPNQASQAELESSLVKLSLGLEKRMHHLGFNPLCSWLLHSILSLFLRLTCHCFVLIQNLCSLLFSCGFWLITASALLLLLPDVSHCLLSPSAMFSLFFIPSLTIWPRNQSHTRNNKVTAVLYPSPQQRVTVRFKVLWTREAPGDGALINGTVIPRPCWERHIQWPASCFNVDQLYFSIIQKLTRCCYEGVL